MEYRSNTPCDFKERALALAPDLVIAICTRNRPVTLSRLLDCLSSQKWPPNTSLLVVDNGLEQSAEQLVHSAAGMFPVTVRYLPESKIGYASVRNRAVNECLTSSAVCFLDDDAVVPNDWIVSMHAAHLKNPVSLVRSRYSHVITMPTGAGEVLDLRESLGSIQSLSPAGTSGLLIPIAALGPERFDEFFNYSGGEDIDLLQRLMRKGVSEIIADTVVFEQQRVASLPLRNQLRLALWNGRLATIMKVRAGLPTVRYRLSSALEIFPALIRATTRLGIGRVHSSAGYLVFAAGRFGMVFGPLSSPSQIGNRPHY